MQNKTLMAKSSTKNQIMPKETLHSISLHLSKKSNDVDLPQRVMYYKVSGNES